MKKYFLGLYFFIQFNNSFAAKLDLINPSFDCKKAESRIEKILCSESKMADLDRVMGALFKKTPTDQIKKSQQAWIKNRNKCVDLLPADEWSCLEKSYIDRIKELEGSEELILLYRSYCNKNAYECYRLGEFEVVMQKWNDAEKDLLKPCQISSDGDMGFSCFKYAVALEHNGKKAEALVQMKKSCETSGNPEACGGAYRLSGKISSNPWVGLYQSSQGPLFVGEISDKKVFLKLQTSWANGHSCTWSGQGIIQNDLVIMDKDPEAPECVLTATLIATKKQNKINLIDKDGKCRINYCGARGMLESEFVK